ncbi:TPA: LuxR family transcriptional regulator [Candidatus Gastranaerophilales bacterium HUM_6]|nr:two component LuxR family transcriptional regulator [Fusobacterium sp. CAG:815]DAA88861.1 MAG TPA: LuxR family transcriptional regulator [Candidatus Gastranaerophilales bacterium HUM_6]DAA93632.1 MAG TPA: LuxR family transcriptional regulator [Candidatus Gastranaerophilales bacterium HUM_7]DAB02250.1 MAG TPA: LuxR family transcriptional regulator [Candidatus Gastranaerophilales bacterium HUM_12]DAB07177.1 MAG TPA: LuxR family transcriptional regulator [Candidatus Gastranaerophilales bacteriu
MRVIKSDTKGSLMKLSPKEHNVLTLIACGFTDKEVALKLNISIRTVQSHIASILLKLKARNRVNAVVVYMHLNPKWKIAERYVVV